MASAPEATAQAAIIRGSQHVLPAGGVTEMECGAPMEGGQGCTRSGTHLDDVMRTHVSMGHQLAVNHYFWRLHFDADNRCNGGEGGRRQRCTEPSGGRFDLLSSIQRNWLSMLNRAESGQMGRTNRAAGMCASVM